MPVYYGYARISSEGQSRYSLNEQAQYLRERADSLGMEFILKSEVMSGANRENRRAFNELLTEPEPGDYVGVAYEDRFGRGGAADIVVLEELHGRGVSVELRGKLFDPDDPTGTFSNEMQLMVAKYYSRLQRQKAQKGIEFSRKNGNFVFNGNLYGYSVRREGTRRIVEVNVGEAETIRRIFKDYKQGMSYSQISLSLEREGITTRRGNRFTETNIRGMVQNPIYMGHYEPNPNRLACKAVDRKRILPTSLVRSSNYPPIVEWDEWWATYNSRRFIGTKYPTRGKFQLRQYEITGILECGFCQRNGRRIAFFHAVHQTMTKHGAINHYPIYTNAQHLPGCTTRPKSYKAEVLEGLFQALFILVFEDPRESAFFVVQALKQRRATEEETAKKVRSTQAQIEKLEVMRKRVETAISHSDEDIGTLVDRRDGIVKQIRSAHATIDEISAPLQMARSELQELMNRFSVRTLRDFFDQGATGQARKKIYKSILESAVQFESGVSVVFRNGKYFWVSMSPAQGRNYQTDFIVRVEFPGKDPEEVLVSWEKNTETFRVHRLTGEGKLGAKIAFVDAVLRRDFDAVEALTKSPLGKNDEDRPVFVESLARFF